MQISSRFAKRLIGFGNRLVDCPAPKSFLGTLLGEAGVNLVFDIGANRGQYAERLRDIGYANTIVSFEPQKEAFGILSNKANLDAAWHVVNVALGAAEGVADLNITENSFSSSILSLRHEMTAIEPGLRNVATEKVSIHKLDDYYGQFITNTTVAFLKLDVQGYEPSVISGASATLHRCFGLQVEMALEPSYVGQALLPEVITLINERDFRLIYLEPGFSDPHTGYTLEVDGYFVRTT